MKKDPKISEAEWQVMKLVWDRAPLAAGEIVEALSSKRAWQPRTIRTLLERLVRKGALRTQLQDKRYLYYPKVSLERCVRKESQSFLARVFGGEASTMLLHFVKHAKLSTAEIAQLKELLAEKER